MDNLKWYKLAQGSIYLYFILNNHFEIVQHSWHLVSFKCVKGRWRQLWWEGLFSALMMCGQPLPGMTFLCQRFQGLGTTSRPLASTFFFGKKWMWFRNVSQSRAIHPGITESQLTVLTAMPRFGDPPLYPSLTRSRCLNPGIRINPTVPPCAPELRDFFFTYLEISLVKPCGFLWWARFLRFDLGLAVPAWSLIGRAHMSTLIRYSMQEKISLWRKSWSRSKDKFVTICQVASAQSNYAGRLVEPSCCKSHATNCT